MAKQKKDELYIQYWFDNAGSRRKRLLANREREVTALRFIDEKGKKYITTPVISLLNPRKIAFMTAKGEYIEGGYVGEDYRITMEVLDTTKVEYIYKNKKK